MKRSLVVLAGVTVLAAALVSMSSGALSSPPAGGAGALVQQPPAAPAGQMVLWGHIKSLARKGGRFEMRFDPAWWLGGVTAERAAVQDGVLAPGDPVPNDHYIVDEGHRLLIYVVSTRARVTVVGRGPRPIAIPVSELEQIVKGKNPRKRPLYDRGNHLGFWIRVGNKYPNPVLSLDQQYQP
jgi:hypothetical protein